MKGIILAGGSGSRLYPLTKVMTKQLQPIYDKPMIYYPLSLLMMMGLKEILIISTPEDTPKIKNLLLDGRNLGINLSYIVQDKPEGIAQAYTLGEEFLNGDDSMMVLGDNLFYGNFEYFRRAVKKQINKLDRFKARVFAYPVNDPERFGVVDFDITSGKVLSLEEKPNNPKSNYAVPGLYIFDGSVCGRVKKQKPSARGELEITDLNLNYLSEGSLACEIIGRGMAWLDTGTPESLLEASNFVHIIEKRQGFKIACIEEVALRQGFISLNQYKEIISSKPNGPYKKYLEDVYDEIFKQNKLKNVA
jgi:glucose-1-phosphate thymidylyltransferase